MRRDIIATVFLLFCFSALLFVFVYPTYYSYEQIIFREVSIPERIFSVCFVILWIALCVISSYFKQLYLFVGGVLYALIPYGSSWAISLIVRTNEGRDVSIISELLAQVFVRLYELPQAPLVGVSILFEPENGARLSYFLLPILLISYFGVKLFRFYRNAYLAEQLRLDDISPGLKRTRLIEAGDVSAPSSSSQKNRKMRVRQPDASNQEKDQINIDESNTQKTRLDEVSIHMDEVQHDSGKKQDS